MTEPDFYRFRLRRASSTRWTSINPVLYEGEVGYEVDQKRFKVGDGQSRWNALAYFIDEDRILQLIQLHSGGPGGGPDPRIGDLDDLTTLNKTSVVAAINEINNPSVSYRVRYEQAKVG